MCCISCRSSFGGSQKIDRLERNLISSTYYWQGGADDGGTEEKTLKS